MAFSFQKTYSPEIEQLLRQYYQSLSEKDAALCSARSEQTGAWRHPLHAKVLACDPHTVRDGMRELKQLPR